MDKIPIPEQDVVPLERIAPDIAGLRVLMVNVYDISHPTGEWMLIDCGLPYSHWRIRNWTEEHFGKGSRPSAILLTHGTSITPGRSRSLPRSGTCPCTSTRSKCRT